MERPILNLDEVELVEQAAGERFRGWLGAIGGRIGARKLGYRLTVVPPGKTAWPCHAHRANEEMFFILSGTGIVRIGPETYPIREGDVIAGAAPGGAKEQRTVSSSAACPMPATTGKATPRASPSAGPRRRPDSVRPAPFRCGREGSRLPNRTLRPAPVLPRAAVPSPAPAADRAA